MKITQKLSLLLVVSLFTVSTANADVLLLVHGWQANADTWRTSGSLSVLEGNGWSDAGVMVSSPQGVVYYPTQGTQLRNKVYRANLITEAPLLFQADQLLEQLRFVADRHPHEKLTVVGHSAGGIVARLALIRPGVSSVNALITIATPNLGTPRALQALNAVDSKPVFCPGPGVAFLKSMFGGQNYNSINYSRASLQDLIPAGPGSLIHWLNQQNHPDIAYYAVIHMSQGIDGDEIVPAFSQDLNLIPILNGRVKTLVTASTHSLNPGDGKLIAEIVHK